MTQNTKYWLMVCSVAAVMFGGVAWFIPAAKEPGVWWFRIGAVAVLGAIWSFHTWVNKRGDAAPDFLVSIADPYFEQNGFAFSIDTEVLDGVCHLRVWFQNRYERACEATVMVRTAERWLAPQRHLPDARVSINCEAGAFGNAVVAWPLPQELQGRTVLLDVMARRKYPRGKGKLLRRRTGLSVGRAPLSGVSDILSVLGVFGGFHGRHAARAQIALPSGVASTPAVSTETRVKTVWRVGDRVPARAGSVRATQADLLQAG